MPSKTTILSWNVNGIRSVHKKGFVDWLGKASPDILCLQEVRAKKDQIPEEILSIKGYHSSWFPAVRPGYSGVGTLSKQKPISVREGFGIEKFDCEGRTLITEFPDFYVLNVYFPRGASNPQVDVDRLTYKLEFYEAFLKFCQKLRKEKPLVISGDVNTAHNPIDLKNPDENVKNTGFLPVERAWVTKLLSSGYVDTYRKLNPEKAEYSWWTHRFAARKRNIGWRIDYHFVTDDLMPKVQEAFIKTDVMGSDHAPVGVVLRP